MNRTEFFQAMREHNLNSDLIVKAYFIAKEAHRLQSRRLTPERYFEHVRRTALLTLRYGHNYTRADQNEFVILSLLHDVIEDTFVPLNVLNGLFGLDRVESLKLLSKERPEYDYKGSRIDGVKKSEDLYYEQLRAAKRIEVVMVKCCDRMDNLADIELWTPERANKYKAETRKYVLPMCPTTELFEDMEKRI